MPTTVESVLVLGVSVSYRQAVMPSHLTGSFLGDDTNNHDFKFSSRGKPVLGVELDNPCNDVLSWSLYGMHSATGTVGDAGTFLIGSDTVDAADKASEAFLGYVFPFFLLRLVFASAPTDVVKLTVNVFLNLMGGVS